ncbi:hypothetical protein BBW68_01750 [Candidatus Erwinia dacicola]|uniref:Uncharacterized protein n=1 Tax=Candidatus Erwinia dacicola TaxID=252393 RepID=A0A1E7YZV7_9GAMM|nr:hypothetical protein BBW68_01750 [Candidatus Erwinia dacicola]RAP67448.1 hypothetical protein ACZ87_03961 [Candidatus Erwinia dacicola]
MEAPEIIQAGTEAIWRRQPGKAGYGLNGPTNPPSLSDVLKHLAYSDEEVNGSETKGFDSDTLRNNINYSYNIHY